MFLYLLFFLSNYNLIMFYNQMEETNDTISHLHKDQDIFSHVEKDQQFCILATLIAYEKEQNQKKINLGVGAYCDHQGNPYVFKIVKKVQDEIHSKPMNHEYLGIDGLPSFVKGARNLVFGEDSILIKNNLVASTQAISGAGALKTGLDFLHKYLKRTVYISNPSWPIHKQMVQRIGFKYSQYPYYSNEIKGLDFRKMMNFFEVIDNGSIIILHACAHNPTGIDLNESQWKQLCMLSKRKSFIPFFDMAYQGFATGDLNKDCWPIRYFAEQGLQIFVAQSFGKNLGLYGERIGALHVITRSQQVSQNVLSQLKIIVRTTYSNPARYGAQIVAKILNNKQYLQQWETELRDIVVKRIKDMRKLLRSQLERIGAKGPWNHITDQIGMFSYTGLSQKACQILTNKYAVYLLNTGRISLPGINEKNVSYLAQSIKNAIEEAKQ